MNNPIVTHQGKQYTVRPLADGLHWRLTEVERPNNSSSLNRDQMILAGFGHIVDGVPADINQARSAQSKAAIAEYLGNEAMWNQAADQFRQATGRALH